MKIKKSIFRDYDIRAIIPKELDMEGVRRITKACIYFFKPKKIAIGRDARNTGKEIVKNMIDVFISSGIDVVDLGMYTTDMMTFASGKFGYDLSIIATASHNPPEYNGFKMAVKGGVSVSGPSGFYKIRDLVKSDKKFEFGNKKGTIEKKDIYKDWIDFCLSFVNINKIKPLKIAIDAGNGSAGLLFGHNYLKQKLPIEILPLYFNPDGSFPNHSPNPLKIENLKDLRKKIKKEKTDLGICLDGDGDRIAFLTEKGKFIPGTITTALIAETLLEKNPGETVLYNAVCGRIVAETVKKAGGKSKRVRVGYSLIKKQMQKSNALFAGEHSCHYFYRDTYNSEASLLTFLLMLEYISEKGTAFSEIIKRFDIYSQSGEINFEVEDKEEMMEKIEKEYQEKAETIDWLDGISIWFKKWWANIRPSNTQPLLRLNIEADNQTIMEKRKEELIQLIESLGGKLSED